MKVQKLATFAATAAMAFGAFAGAQIYEMTITVKSTTAKYGKTEAVVCETPSNETGLYRKQSTVKLKGLFWGCDCETIASPLPAANATDTYGYIFWNETTREVIAADFSWSTLNRIEKKLNKAEGAWVLANTNNTFTLVGGGFGTVKDSVSKAACTIDETILTPMSGHVAGWMTLKRIVVTGGTPDDCKKCEVVSGTDEVVAVAPGWSLCYCSEDSDFTAVSGTWKLKFLSSQSKKWGKVDASESITNVYSFPSYVVSYINALSKAPVVPTTPSGSETAPAAETTTPAAETTTPAAETTTPAAESGTTPAAETETPAAETTTPAAEPEATPAAESGTPAAETETPAAETTTQSAT